jgi:hypothetical protein
VKNKQLLTMSLLGGIFIIIGGLLWAALGTLLGGTQSANETKPKQKKQTKTK